MKTRVAVNHRWLIVVIVSLLTIGCADNQSRLKGTRLVDTIQSREEFLMVHPTGKQADEAKLKLKSLYYQKATEVNTITSYEAFLERYPGEPGDELSDQVRSSLQSLEFMKGWKTDTIEGYETFNKRYPESILSKVALSRQEILYFRDVEGTENIKGCEKYLERFPQGLYADRVESNLKRLRFEKTMEVNTIRAFKVFLKHYPDGVLSDRIRQSMEIQPGIYPTIKKEIENLNSPDPLRRAKSALFFGKVGPVAGPAVRYLVELLGDYTVIPSIIVSEPVEDAEITLSKIASDVLIKIGEPAVDPLIAALKDYGNDWAITAEIISVLRRIKTDDPGTIIDPLVYVLKDKRYFLFWGSVTSALTDFFPDYRVENALMEALNADQHNIIVKALIDSEFSSRFEKLLIKTGRERNPGAIKLLEYVTDPDAVEVLLDVLRDKDPFIRKMASLALKDKQETRVVRALMITAQNDRVTKVRKAAKKSLENMGIAATVRISDIPSITPWNIWKDEMERLDDTLSWQKWPSVDREDDLAMD